MLTEQQLEDLGLTWFADTGWQVVSGLEIAPDSDRPARSDYRQVLLREHLINALIRINPDIPPAALEQVIDQLNAINDPQAIVRNRRMYEILRGGVDVAFVQGEHKKQELAQLIDFNRMKSPFMMHWPTMKVLCVNSVMKPSKKLRLR